jgi:hypothetical protein
MPKKVEDLILWTALKASLLQKIGLGLIIIVSTCGIVRTGLDGFWSLRIGPKGLIVIWIGIALILSVRMVRSSLLK